MLGYNEVWRQEDFIPRHQMHLKDLPKNHIKKIKSVKFEFADYEIYDRMSCLPYYRMAIHCANNYGIIGAAQNRECFEMMNFFTTCVETNQIFSKLKETQPEAFVSSQYSREKPNFSELSL